MNAAVLFRWKAPGVATPSARRTAIVSSLPSRLLVPAGKRSAGAYTSIIGIVEDQVRAGFMTLQLVQAIALKCRLTGPFYGSLAVNPSRPFRARRSREQIRDNHRIWRRR